MDSPKMNTVYQLKRTLVTGIIVVIALLPVAVGKVKADTPAGDQLKPLLRRLLAETSGLSERDRALYAYVIDHYLPECPGKRFRFTRLEEALRMEDPVDGTLIVDTSVACDDTKNKPDMLFAGEYLRLNQDFTLRTRLDSYKPIGELETKLKAAVKKLEEEQRNPQPQPAEEELRQKQVSGLLALLDTAGDVNDKERRVYREVMSHLAVCEEEDGPHSFETIQDAIWLHPFNKGYLAVSLTVCGWNDLDAFLLDTQGQLQGRFTLPAGKYGLGSPYEFRISDFTGDGEQEFYYHKMFPTSSVPVFTTWVRLYKLKAGGSAPQLILEMEVEEQDCFEAQRSGNNIGNRRTAEMEFVSAQGLLKIMEEEATFDCAEFSWGEKPVQTLKTLSTKQKILRWDPFRFSYVQVED